MFTNWLTSPSTSSNMGILPPAVITTPPDIILEVGPSPSARFVAHSIVLAMHSGYLRSAIRLDENGLPNSDPPIFLTNVTPEQFSPLLTYMYTGYLDLNVENIFGVLLATHVLHMPRALEICRNFLSRMQSEGYLNGAFLTHLNEVNSNSSSTGNPGKYSNSVKVIRPIASKPTIPNLGFIVPPMPHISLPSTGTPFRSLNNQNKMSTLKGSPESNSTNDSPSPSLPQPQPSSSSFSSLPSNHILPKTLSSINKDLSSKRSPKLKRPSTSSSTEKSKRTDSVHQPLLSSNPKRESDNENKIIIDVASCDGPVRFRRVLNDAYGKQPQTIDLLQMHTQERSHQSVSHSFHQQMAKTISQQRQQHSAEESENSEDSKHQHGNHQTNGEVYNCVYCKHTFKSQYCYQKHAKRHLNPLSLEASDGTGVTLGGGGGTAAAVVVGTAGPATTITLPTGGHHSSSSSSADPDKDEKISNRSLDLKREVRPLDMNVQYYPCKTCGSKFPSYYFVHKHRKMCHANEDNNNQ